MMKIDDNKIAKLKDGKEENLRARKLAFVCSSIMQQNNFSFEKREAVADMCNISYRALSDENRVLRMAVNEILKREDLELGFKVLATLLDD